MGIDDKQNFLRSLRRQEALQEEEFQRSRQVAIGQKTAHSRQKSFIDSTETPSDTSPPSPPAADDSLGLFDEEFYEEIVQADLNREAKVLQQLSEEPPDVTPDSALNEYTQTKQKIAHKIAHDVLLSVSTGSVQTETLSDLKTPEASSNELNAVDEQYFSEALTFDSTQNISHNSSPSHSNLKQSASATNNDSVHNDFGVIDEHYFSTLPRTGTNILKDVPATHSDPEAEPRTQSDHLSQLNSDELNYFDQIMTGTDLPVVEDNPAERLRTEAVRSEKSPNVGSANNSQVENQPTLQKRRQSPRISSDTAGIDHSNSSIDNGPEMAGTSVSEGTYGVPDQHSSFESQTVDESIQKTRKISNKLRLDPRKSQPSQLGEYATEEEGSPSDNHPEPDTKKEVKRTGEKTLLYLVGDLDKEPGYSIVDMLIAGKVYEDDRLICLNKPYGLASQGGAGLYHSITKYLPEIAARLKCDQPLYLCHRLDQNCSGAIIVAKGEDWSKNLKRRFETGDLSKTYSAITNGVPKQLRGCIDIPIATDTIVSKKYRRSVLVPHDTMTHRKGVYNSKTEYEVVKRTDSAALLHLYPLQGRKHQIRVHLADGLGCAILGDHKYSDRTRLAPQRLPGSTLLKFQLEQSKARHMPMHLHASKLVLPNYFHAGRDLTLSAQLPKFFSRSIKLLKFWKKWHP